MNAIHTPGLADEPVVSSGLSPEQRAVLAVLQAPDASGASSASGAVPGITAHVQIVGGVDERAMHLAVDQALGAHEQLHAAFGEVHGYRGLRQWPLPMRPALDWSSTDLGAGDAALAAWLRGLASPLRLAEGQSLRAGLARISDTRHVLALHLSTLIADEGSLLALLAQIAAAYAAEVGERGDRGESPATDAFDTADIFQYAQYVEWRAELAAGEEADIGGAYWRAHLADHLDGGKGDSADGQEPRLPTPLAPIASHVEARLTIAPDLAGRVAASQVGAERLLHAVWLSLLARLGGYERFVSGWRHDCRDDYEVMRGAVGVFEKVLPVAVALTGETSVADWLGRCAAVAAAHVDAQEYWPVDAPPVTAHLASIFHWRTLPPMAAGWSTPVVERAPGTPGTTEVAGALTLEVRWGEQGERCELVLHADGQRHSQQAVERMLAQFVTLLGQTLDRPHAAVRDLDPIGPEERAALLRAAQGERRDIGALTVSQHIAEWAALSPQAPALEAGGMVLDYRTLNRRANQLARAMATLGVTPGAIVALNLPRGADLIVAMLAAWRAGAAYLPLEPAWPQARREALLADASPALVLSAATLTGDVLTPEGQAAIDLRQLDGSLPATQPRSGDLAYVLYTSGSTGQPKGVAIEHGQLLNYVVASTVAMDLAASRRWGLTSSVVADLGNTALFGALFNGACLVVANEDDTRNPAAFARFVETLRIDAVKIVPSHLEALLDGEAPRVPRTVVLGGEAAPRALIERLRRLAPDTAIHNHYGPTETTVGVLVHRVRASDLQGGDALPLTQVLANNRVLVLDEAMRLVPAGGAGQVYVGGPQVCRGYLAGSGTRLSDAFVDDPFHPGERLYRTGDIARVLPEGGLRLVGRADHQVKLRGFRVDPAEIEVALLGLPEVRQAAVLAEPGATGERVLIACVALADSEPDDTGAEAPSRSDRGERAEREERPEPAARVERLRDALKAILPGHLVPTRIHVLDDFPRLPNGKLDRAAIVALAAAAVTAAAAAAGDGASSLSQAVAGARAREPRDALETVLSQGMGLLLGRGPIGIDEDFFELGGHSLLVIRLVARLRRLLGIEIEPGLVFDHPTVAELAAALRTGPWDTSGFERLAATDWQRTETAAAPR